MTIPRHIRDSLDGLRARPTTYNGIPMRSRLEARVAAVWQSSAEAA